MKKLVAITVMLASLLMPVMAQNRAQQVIAHRGYWNVEGSAQNSISALQNTHKIGVYGSEFDVHITRDGVVVVYHDDLIEGVKIEDAQYADIRDKRLENGEVLPTLRQYLEAAKPLEGMRLILEIKVHAQPADEIRCVDAVLPLVEEAGLAGRTEYISFSRNVCDYLLQKQPKALVSYLNGDLTPRQAKKAGYAGIDYNAHVFLKHPKWVKKARKLGLITNVWTVNEKDKMQLFYDMGMDFITTNEPLTARDME